MCETNRTTRGRSFGGVLGGCLLLLLLLAERVAAQANSTTASPSVASPTLAPSGAAATFPVCQLCPSPDQVFAFASATVENRTCQVWQELALGGAISPQECEDRVADEIIETVCECVSPPPPPTAAPTAAPTPLETTAVLSTAAPTVVRTLTADVVLGLVNVTTPMSPVHREYFGPQLALYLETAVRQILAPDLSVGWTGTVTAQLLRYDGLPSVADAVAPDGTRHQRRLRHDDNQKHRARRRTLQATATSEAVPLATRTTIVATQTSTTGGPPLLSSALFQLYIQDVLERDDAQAFLDQLVDGTASSPTLRVYFDKIRSAVVYPPEAIITQGDGGAPPPGDDEDINANDDDDDDKLSLWVIVGIAGGAGVCLIAIAAGLLCHLQPETVWNSQRVESPAPNSPSNGVGFSTSPTNAKMEASPSSRRSAAASLAKKNVEEAALAAAAAAGKIPADDDDDADDDDESTYYANASVLNPPTVTQFDDNQSYAYSLEPGHVDNQTVGGGTTTSTTNYSRSKRGTTRAAAAAVATPPRGRNSINDDDTNTVTRRGTVTRQVHAPPGKLGIIIDTSLEGPIVHRVNTNSPLYGQVFPGDIITSINNIDTRAMKASAITQIMVRTANEPRVLHVASDDVTVK